jgi:hypothetical protein
MKTHAKPVEVKALLCNSKAEVTTRIWTADPAKVSCGHCRRSLRKGIQTTLPLDDLLTQQAEGEQLMSMYEQGLLQPEDI